MKPHPQRLVVAIFAVIGIGACAIANEADSLQSAALPQLSRDRVAKITTWLPSSPVAFTPPFADRVWWDAVARSHPPGALATEADRQAALPPPVLTEDLFDAYRETGQRKPYEIPYALRIRRLGIFLFSEGLCNDGRYLAAIEHELDAILAEPTWAVPAHTPARDNWHDARAVVDLGAAVRAGNLALADYLLGDRLATATRIRIRDEIHARVFDPWLERVRNASYRGGDQRDFWWMNRGNNWNAVCNGGILSAALHLGPPASAGRGDAASAPDIRAEVIAAYESLTESFIAGFGDDGFCHEGIAYWTYGYGNYTIGSELIRLASGGRIDLLAGEKQRLIATFDTRWRIVGNLYPPFGDANIDARAPAWLHDFATLRYATAGGIRGLSSGLGIIHDHGLGANLAIATLDLSLPRPPAASTSGHVTTSPTLPLRDWFPDGGALVVRRSPAAIGLAAAFKGGHNGQPHNHNDLGSFVIVCDGETVLTDLGNDAYVKDTFGSKRYNSGVMNSFGHPVPRVAGKLQRTGRSAQADTIRAEFSDTQDVWEIDLTSAYIEDVPSLQKLTRTFVFIRQTSEASRGQLEITDQVKFKNDQRDVFESALILLPKQVAKPLSANDDSSPGLSSSFLIQSRTGGSKVKVKLEAKADGAPSTIIRTDEAIIGIVPAQGARGTRLGFRFPQAVTNATLRFTITPAL